MIRMTGFLGCFILKIPAIRSIGVLVCQVLVTQDLNLELLRDCAPRP